MLVVIENKNKSVVDGSLSNSTNKKIIKNEFSSLNEPKLKNNNKPIEDKEINPNKRMKIYSKFNEILFHVHIKDEEYLANYFINKKNKNLEKILSKFIV